VTHDELLKEIDFELGLSDYDTWREGAKALRAVVELHCADEGNWAGEKTVCDWCKVTYPCPTIQAIEKELK